MKTIKDRKKLYTKAREVLFGWAWFYGISTIVGHLMPNPFDAYIKYMISKHILKITFLNKWSSFFLCTQLNGFT